jgi:hypothetical protein
MPLHVTEELRGGMGLETRERNVDARRGDAEENAENALRRWAGDGFLEE